MIIINNFEAPIISLLDDLKVSTKQDFGFYEHCCLFVDFFVIFLNNKESLQTNWSFSLA